MIDRILDLASRSAYDFRKTANPDDPLSYLFDEWVPYYQLKWSIARALQPRRILEIGVRYGYSAAAFLDGAPDSTYLGIDNDSDTFGGRRGALTWARETISSERAQFLVGDSQVMGQFPGGFYDLIHLDGQQDGPSSIADLKKALRQARHILVDGYFWTRDNFLHVSEFVFRYRDLIESCIVIPGYAGELLITPAQNVSLPVTASTSADLRNTYSTSYYLRDCGGFDSFKRNRNGILEDIRLKSIADLARIAPMGRAIDLGSGRGELSIYLAREGYRVLSVDYSDSAIGLAREASAAAGCSSKIDYYSGDVNSAPFSSQYSLAVASDLVEHLTSEELDRLYGRVAAHLSSDGVLIIHTFPNAWYYKYDYPRKLRSARVLGAYLPSEPRSRYEELMHINEQSPRVLRDQLKVHFDNVLVWFADHDLREPFSNLARRFSRAEMRAAGDLYAIASHFPMDLQILRRLLEMHPVPSAGKMDFRILEIPETVSPGSTFKARVRLRNNSESDLKSQPPNPIHLAYHCYSRGNETLVFDGLRSAIPILKPGAEIETTMSLRAPATHGSVRFRLTVVQEFVTWFDEAPHEVFEDKIVCVE